MRPSTLLCLVALAGCGGSGGGVAPQTAKPRVAAAEAATPPPPSEPQPKDKVPRASVDAALKAGLGKFLGNLDVEAHVENGKFVGWKILELRGDMWAGVDLKVGDIVTRVNGLKIERENEANAAFKSLGVASEIRVNLIRNGQPTEIRFAIED
jgi:type II secretory pathway component PulC